MVFFFKGKTKYEFAVVVDAIATGINVILVTLCHALLIAYEYNALNASGQQIVFSHECENNKRKMSAANWMHS